ncbi:hypothetical protein RHS01_00857 [Rhizoctonia solani]|uniref:Protein F37C4,5 [Caenorhabditis elegans] n=1 Tax=Rhizoctonia solani TaxID=456999 RepID=A0A8H7IN97_9AGAM|nr:hypothetical protein RHS01_00857 [Rhizoctonia solani]
MVDSPVSHRVKINASEQDHLIDSVTVFQTGQAEIKRHVQLHLKIVTEHLPSLLVEDSLRVQGTGTAIIFDVVYHSPNKQSRLYPKHDESSDEGNEEESECYDTIQALEKQRSTVESQVSFLQAYGSSLSSQNYSVKDLDDFLDMYGSRQDALNKRIRELDLDIKRAKKTFRTVQKKQTEHKPQAYRRTKVTVTVISEEEGRAELILTYVVWNASWTPIYEVRASMSSSPNSPSTVMLHYRASLTQTTGEDWSEATLTLSTAAPYRGVNMPILSTWRIGVPPMAERREQYRSRSRSRSLSRSPIRIARVLESSDRSASRGRPCSPILPVIKDKPTSMTIRQASEVDTGVLSATFKIPGISNIPSDEGNHKVLICSLDLQINPEWICIPRKDEAVFLRVARSAKSSAQVNSQIQDVPTNDSFQLSLGTDPTLRVTYVPVQTHKHTTSEPGFNFPGRPRKAVVLKVAEKSEFGLRGALRAQWAPPDVAGQGAIQWLCAIGAGEEVELKLGWEVSAPEWTE